MEKEYRYDAFISYRHSDLDSYVAENIHKYLETYKLPKNVQDKIGIKGRSIKRIFRDQDELPLSSNLESPIVEALNDSKFLIVICSPRLKESVWCKKEIETFKKIRGRENIFCVLAEGEPDESFPEEVLFDYKEEKGKDGKLRKVKEFFEPLAADVRGENKREILKKIKSERLRLIAPMFNLNYDDLKQRHRQRKIRKTIFTLSVVATASLLLALYSALMFLKISHQQKVLKLHQAQTLAKESESYLAIDDKYNAVKSAYEALTKFKGVKMPYTTDAEYQLVKSLNVYNAGLSYNSRNEIKTKGVVDFIKTSANKKYLLSYDESEELNLWDANTLKKIKTFSDIDGFSFGYYSFSFINEGKVAYINGKGSVVVYDISSDKIITTLKKNDKSYQSLNVSKDGKYLSYHDDKTIYLYDSAENKVISEAKLKIEIQKPFKFTPDGEYIIAVTNSTAMEVINGKSVEIFIFDIKDLSNPKTITVNADYLENITYNNNIAYALLNNSEGIESNNALIIAFNYKNGDVKFTKEINKTWGKAINKVFNDKHEVIAVSHANELTLIDPSDGKTINRLSVNDNVIDIFSFNDQSLLLLFQENGFVNFINLDKMTNIIYNDLFNLNLNEYKLVDNTSDGFILVPNKSNRIIFYDNKADKALKKVSGDYSILTNQTIGVNNYDAIKKEYNIEKKNMVSNIIYGDNKKILIVSYVDKTAAIYDVKTKKHLNTISDVTTINNYIGKDKYNRTYIGSVTDCFVLDEEYNKVGYIRNVNSVDKKNNKLIIYKNDGYYSLPIYKYDEVLKLAEEYLK